MKKILIALAVLLAVQVADAQTKSPEAAKKALVSAQEASQDAKKATKFATWLKLASAYIDAYNAPAGNIVVGMDRNAIAMSMNGKQPLSAESIVLLGEEYIKDSYEDIDLYYNSGNMLVMIVVKNPVVENALGCALEAYKKAHELDVKGSKTKDINAGIEKIKISYANDATSAYQLGDNKKASELFACAVEAAATAPYSQVDTLSMYNAAFTAYMVQDNKTALKYFEKCAEVGYHQDGAVCEKIGTIYMALGETEKGVKILEEGFITFPQSQNILYALINHYVSSESETDKLFALIDKAKAGEPNNPVLHYVEGNAYVQLKQMEKAEEAYNRCLAIDPNYDFAHYALGAMHYDYAISLLQQAAEEMDQAKYEALVEESVVAFKKAINPFEKAYEVSKNSQLKTATAECLKSIYYRFSSDSDEYMQNYKKYDEILKAM